MKLFKKPLSILLALIMVMTVVIVAPASVQAGEASVIQGTFTMKTFDGTDPGVLDYYYSDSYFSASGKETDPHLRTMSSALAFTMSETSNTPVETYGGILTNIGFTDIETYDMDHTAMDSMGVVLAHKNIDGKDVVAVALRGDRYELEMAANSIAGSEGDIKTFADAESLIEGRVSNYLTQHGITNAKYWVVGYSRAGAVADLFGRELNKNPATFLTTEDDIYVYTFEAPASSAENTAYENIHNIIDLRDIVVYLYPSAWQIYNCGTPDYIGTTDETISIKSFDFFTEDHTNTIAKAKTTDYLNDLLGFVTSGISRETYSEKLQAPLSQILQIYFSLDNVQQKTVGDYLKAVLNSMMNDEEMITTVGLALALPDNPENITALINFLKKNMDLVADELGKPVDDASYQLIQDSLTPVIETLLPVVNMDFFAEYDLGDGSDTITAPLYHIMTAAGNIMNLIKHHLNYNVFRELTDQDSNYPKVGLVGDVDRDGKITIDDATLIQRRGILLEKFNEAQDILADTNGDKRVSIFDVTCVQKYLAEYKSGTGNIGKTAYKDGTIE